MRDLSTKHLRAFVTVCDCGSITSAAAVLGVTQPALSTTIQQAEELVELRLLDRSARRARPTAAGLLLLPQARRILSEVKSATTRLRDLAAGRMGHISIATLPSAVDHILALTLAAFKSIYPDIRISVRDALNAEVVALVRTGQADIGIGAHDGTMSDIEQVIVYEDRFIAVIPVHHPLAGRKHLTWDSLRNEAFIGGAAGSNTRAMVQKTLRIKESESMIECSFVPTTIGMVGHGLGVSVLSELACRPFRNDPRIVLRELRPMTPRPIAIIRDPKSAGTAAAELFMSFFQRANGSGSAS
jgi:LysR family carnitine catabolism transcriptional activator